MSRTYNDSTDTTRTRNGAIRLTDNSVKGLPQPPKGNQITYDERLRGFGVRVTAKGKKAFVLNYRINGRERRITIGAYPEWTLLAARRRAEEMRRDVDLGIDPLQRRTDKMNEPTVQDLFERYVTDHLPKKSQASVVNDLHMWRKSILPTLSHRNLSEVTFSEVDALHRKITRRAPITANRTVSLLRKAFNLAIRWNWMTANPAVGIEGNPENSRTRYLGEDEIARLLKALESNPNRTSCDAILFMLLTGQRLGEVAGITDHEIKADVWHLPSNRTKNDRSHDVPLSQAAKDVLANLPRIDGGYILTTNGETPICGFHKTRLKIAKYMEIEAANECGKPVEILHWTFHDLRRTTATGLARLGVAVRVTEAVLNHVSGTGGGIVAVYQRHDYADEKRRALDAWARFVHSVLEAEEGNVVRIEAKA